MITLRKANKEDIPKLWDFEKENRLFDRKLLGSKFKQSFSWDINKKEEQTWKEVIKKDLQKPNHLFLIAENKIQVGYIWGYYNKSKKGYINEVFVTKKQRGKKISSLLMKEMLKWFKKNKITTISLHVFAPNEHAIMIYKKWGFIPFSLDMKKKL